MNTVAIAMAGSVLLFGLALGGLAQMQAPQPSLVEGKDKPILLARVVVTATALPDRPLRQPAD